MFSDCGVSASSASQVTGQDGIEDGGPSRHGGGD
jgi:hypothetical protein